MDSRPDWADCIAAQLWCKPKHQNKAMDPDLACDIADALRESLASKTAEVEALKKFQVHQHDVVLEQMARAEKAESECAALKSQLAAALERERGMREAAGALIRECRPDPLPEDEPEWQALWDLLTPPAPEARP